MLQIIWAESLKAKIDWVHGHPKPAQVRWVVGDLMSKRHLTDLLFNHTDCVGGEQVLRATELWSLLLKKNRPDLRVLQMAGAQMLVKAFFTHAETIPWCARPGAASRFLSDLKSLGAFPAHPDVDALLYDFKNQFEVTDSDLFLQTAFLAGRFYQYCLDIKTIPWLFSPLILSQEEGGLKGIEGDFVFDLSHSMTLVERDLIHLLARTNQVTVLVPGKNSDVMKVKGLWPYVDLGLGLPRVKEEAVSTPLGQISHVASYPSFNLEVRQTVSQVANLVSSGVPPSKIGIVAKNLSNYEMPLSRELAWEGIPLNSDQESSLLAKRDLQKVLSALRLAQGDLTPERLQTVFGLTAAQTALMRPVQVANHIYDPILRDRVARLVKPQGDLGALEFEELVIGTIESFADPSDDHWISALSVIRQEAPPVRLPLRLWNDFVEGLWQKKALVTKHGSSEGIQLATFREAESLDVEFLFFLGLSESSLEATVISDLNLEKRKFFSDLGFDFSKSATVKDDYLCEWLQSHNAKTLYFSFAQIDAEGSACTPSGFWVTLENALGLHFQESDPTVWERVTSAIVNPKICDQVANFKGLGAGSWTGLPERITKTSQVRLSNIPHQPLPFSMSASSLETYFDCPFRFFAGKVLKLREIEELDIDPRPMDRGQWIHKVVEVMGKEKKDLDTWSVSEWDELLSQIAVKQITVAPETWPVFRKQLLKQLQRFIEFEKRWDPRMSTARYVEAKIEGFLAWNDDEEKVSLVKEKDAIPLEASFVPFTGKIDRVDVTPSGYAVLVDYKSSASKAKILSSWAKDGSFQMPLYASAIESGFLEETHSVIASQYYSFKPLDRSKGFAIKGLGEKDLIKDEKALSPSKRSWVSEDAYNKSKQEIFAIMADLMKAIKKGDFSPKPRDEKECRQCQWKLICRADHL